MKSKYWIILSIAIISIGTVFGLGYKKSWWQNQAPLPDAFMEYKRLYEAFTNPDTSSVIEGTVDLFDEEKNMQKQERLEFLTYKNGALLYSAFGPVKILCDGKRIVVIDSVLKKFEYTVPDAATLQQLNNTNPVSNPLEVLLKDT